MPMLPLRFDAPLLQFAEREPQFVPLLQLLPASRRTLTFQPKIAADVFYVFTASPCVFLCLLHTNGHWLGNAARAKAAITIRRAIITKRRTRAAIRAIAPIAARKQTHQICAAYLAILCRPINVSIPGPVVREPVNVCVWRDVDMVISCCVCNCVPLHSGIRAPLPLHAAAVFKAIARYHPAVVRVLVAARCSRVCAAADIRAFVAPPWQRR